MSTTNRSLARERRLRVASEKARVPVGAKVRHVDAKRPAPVGRVVRHTRASNAPVACRVTWPNGTTSTVPSRSLEVM